MSFQPRKPIQFKQFKLQNEEKAMKTVTYTVPNISCMHCVHTIKTEVSDLQGVQSVNADAATKKVTIAFDAPATEEEIVALLTEINYAPELN